MTALLIITSVTTIVLQNSLFNFCCKTSLETNAHINRFNATIYSVCIMLFALLLFRENISLYTALWGVLLGVATALSNTNKVKALSEGPMNITLLITTSSMIIPTLSGLFFGEAFSKARFFAVLLLIYFIYLSIDKGTDTGFKKTWFVHCGLAFIFQGAIGVIQKIHQSSPHKTEVSGLLFCAFICAIVFCLFRMKCDFNKITFGKKNVIIGIICGFCTFGMNYINLKLSGMLPSQLFFPLTNGSSIILSSIISVVLFKETLSKRQCFGLVGGIISLIAICIIP